VFNCLVAFRPYLQGSKYAVSSEMSPWTFRHWKMRHCFASKRWDSFI